MMQTKPQKTAWWQGIFLGTLALITALLAVAPAHAQIYKYQDQNGKWHFTDKAPKRGQDTEVLNLEAAQQQEVETDLVKQLQKNFVPGSPVEESTLAVVKVVTLAGSGSGFFVSNDGYIVTNKHVVRPNVSNSWNQIAEQFETQEQRFEQFRRNLDREKKNIEKYESDLRRFKDSIAASPTSVQAAKRAEYEEYSQRLAERKRDYRNARKQYRQEYNKFKDQQSDHRWRSANANTAQRFTIQLKDETELSVILVKLSQDHDLALLKLEGYTTPMLSIDGARRSSQGDPVYAMGSPLGMSDYVTSGIITRVSREALVTDAKILPGNSGGPLVTPQGEVVGVNTQKLTPGRDVMADGFGIAIPIAVVTEEFPNILPPRSP